MDKIISLNIFCGNKYIQRTVCSDSASQDSFPKVAIWQQFVDGRQIGLNLPVPAGVAAAPSCCSAGKSDTEGQLQSEWGLQPALRAASPAVLTAQHKTHQVKWQNLVASAFAVVDLGDDRLRNEYNMPFRPEKRSLVSYLCLSIIDVDFRIAPFSVPVKITNAKYILTILLLLIPVYYFFENTQKYTFLIVNRKQ